MFHNKSIVKLLKNYVLLDTGSARWLSSNHMLQGQMQWPGLDSEALWCVSSPPSISLLSCVLFTED